MIKTNSSQDRDAHSSVFLVFDIGGTTTRAGIFDHSNSLSLRETRATSLHLRDSANPEATLSTLLSGLAADLECWQPYGVVIAAPGPVIGGVVTKLPTLLGPNTDCPDIVAIARTIWPAAKVWLCNDLVSTGYGLVARGHSDFCVLTCGSGIGAKLFLKGRPLLGLRGMGGEIGHWRVPGVPDLACDCGGRGHLGAVASGRGTLRLLQHLAETDRPAFAASHAGKQVSSPNQLSTEIIVEQFHARDQWTINALRTPAKALASTFACLHLATGIEQFFVTGGFASALGPDYMKLIANSAVDACWETGIDWEAAVQLADPAIEWGLAGGEPYARDNPPDFAFRGV